MPGHAEGIDDDLLKATIWHNKANTRKDSPTLGSWDLITLWLPREAFSLKFSLYFCRRQCVDERCSQNYSRRDGDQADGLHKDSGTWQMPLSPSSADFSRQFPRVRTWASTLPGPKTEIRTLSFTSGWSCQENCILQDLWWHKHRSFRLSLTYKRSQTKLLWVQCNAENI